MNASKIKKQQLFCLFGRVINTYMYGVKYSVDDLEEQHTEHTIYDAHTTAKWEWNLSGGVRVEYGLQINCRIVLDELVSWHAVFAGMRSRL